MKRHAALILTAVALAAAALAWMRSGEVVALKREYLDLTREHAASSPAERSPARVKPPADSSDPALEQHAGALRIIQSSPGDFQSPEKAMALTKWLAGAVAGLSPAQLVQLAL